MTEFRNGQCRSTWKMTCVSIYDGSSFGSSYTGTTWCPDDWLNVLWLSVVVWMSNVSNWLMFLDIWSLDGSTVLEGSVTFRGWSLVRENRSLLVRTWGLIAQSTASSLSLSGTYVIIWSWYLVAFCPSCLIFPVWWAVIFPWI